MCLVRDTAPYESAADPLGELKGSALVLTRLGHLPGQGLCPLVAHGAEGHGGRIARPLAVVTTNLVDTGPTMR